MGGRAFSSLAILWIAVTGVSCSSDRGTSRNDQELNTMIDRIASGDLVRGINEGQMGPHAVLVNEEGVTTLGDVGLCPELSGLPVDADAAEWIPIWDQCFSELTREARAWGELIALFLRFQFDPNISNMSSEQLFAFLGSPELFKLGIRSELSNNDLKELQRLAEIRQRVSVQAEANLFMVIDQNRDRFEGEKQDPRFASFLVLRDSESDSSGVLTSQNLLNLIGPIVGRLSVDSQFPFQLMHPYAILALVPRGKEPDQLPLRRDPFSYVFEVYNDFGALGEANIRRVKNYRHFRNLGKTKKIEEGLYLPDSDAVKVAFFDSGVDYVRYEYEIGSFLGTGVDGQLQSRDFADGDDSAYAPSFNSGAFGHGTGTLAAMLTLVARHSQLLQERKLDLSMLKFSSDREFLGAFPYTFNAAGNRPALFSAVSQLIKEPVQPDLLSFSGAFPIQYMLKQAKQEDLLLQTRWLWVIAAGNQGAEVQPGGAECMSDVPSSTRPVDRILCVGALKRGITIPAYVAKYSNHGPVVDVYTYETLAPDYCPSGTSCAVPTISAAAAIIKKAFPMLTSEQLKEVIVEASTLKNLPLEGVNMNLQVNRDRVEAGDPKVSRSVRVFDFLDTTHDRAMEKAMKLASEKVSGNLIQIVKGPGSQLTSP